MTAVATAPRASATTEPGTRPLSDVARHLVQPSGIVRTYWPRVRETCAELGLGFDRWQDGAGRLILSQRSSGKFAAGIGGVVLSWPRQVGKTYLIGAIIVALCLLRPGMLALWTAHHGKTINETFRAMRVMVERKAIKRHVKQVRTGNGDEGIEFRNGSRILFGARDAGFGLGFTGVSLLVFDEAQRLTQRAVDDMVPTTNTGDNPLVFFIGTPPRPTDGGEKFAALRSKALKVHEARERGEDPRNNVLYVELSADPTTDRNASTIDWQQLAKANPSYPHRVPEDAIERMWELLGAESFWREGYGIWDEVGIRPPVILADEWDPLAIPATATPTEGSQAFGVKFSADGSRYCVGVGLASEAGVHVEALPPTPMAQGTTALADWLAVRWRATSVIVIDGQDGAEDLRTLLKARGVPARRIKVLTAAEAIAAHTAFLRGVHEGTVTHYGQPGLTAAVGIAAKRAIGKHGGWGWEATTPGGDVSPVEAVTLAAYGATTTRRPPGGDGRTGRSPATGRRRAVVM